MTYTIDITAPTITHDGPADTIDLTNGNQTLFSITDANGVTEELYAWDSDANQTLNSPFDITLAGLTDGSHTIHVYARDEAGNWDEISVTYTIDITAPTITHDGPADTIDLTNGNQTLFSITDANTVTQALYHWDSDANQTLNSPYDITLAGLTDGSHTIHVYARDEAAIGQKKVWTYTIDITAPTITHDGPADIIDLTNGNQTLFSITDANSVTQALIIGIVMLIQTLNSPYDITLASLADGSHTIHVYARDEAGNWAEESVTYTIDITAPTIYP